MVGKQPEPSHLLHRIDMKFDQLLDLILGMQFQYTAVVGDNYSNKESITSGKRARRGVMQMQEISNITRNALIPKQRKKMLPNPANKRNTAKLSFH